MTWTIETSGDDGVEKTRVVARDEPSGESAKTEAPPSLTARLNTASMTHHHAHRDDRGGEPAGEQRPEGERERADRGQRRRRRPRRARSAARPRWPATRSSRTARRRRPGTRPAPRPACRPASTAAGSRPGGRSSPAGRRRYDGLPATRPTRRSRRRRARTSGQNLFSTTRGAQGPECRIASGRSVRVVEEQDGEQRNDPDEGAVPELHPHDAGGEQRQRTGAFRRPRGRGRAVTRTPSRCSCRATGRAVPGGASGLQDGAVAALQRGVAHRVALAAGRPARPGCRGRRCARCPSASPRSRPRPRPRPGGWRRRRSRLWPRSRSNGAEADPLLGVKPGGRLVEQQQVRVVDDAPARCRPGAACRRTACATSPSPCRRGRPARRPPRRPWGRDPAAPP